MVQACPLQRLGWEDTPQAQGGLLCLSLIISTALLGIKACTAALHFVNLTVEHALEWERHVAGSEIVFYLQTAVFAKGCFDGGLGQ